MSDKASRTFEVRVESPHGSQAVEQFYHFLQKVASDAEARWGISITVNEVANEPEHTEGFE